MTPIRKSIIVRSSTGELRLPIAPRIKHLRQTGSPRGLSWVIAIGRTLFVALGKITATSKEYSMSTVAVTVPAVSAVVDTGRIRLGSAFRLLPIAS